MKTKRNLYFILTLAWVIVIFSFSLQTGNESGGLSSGITKWFVDIFLPGFEDVELLSFLIRKCAHFTEFAILGILASLTASETRLPHKPLCAFAFSAFIASCDETLQLFVDGRAGMITDVLLDSCGALAGVLLVWGVKKVLEKRK